MPVKSDKSDMAIHGVNNMEVKLPTEKKMIWHYMIGHIGEKGLKTLNKNLADGLVDFNLEFDLCKHCIYGKKIHIQIYSSSQKSSSF